MNNQIEVKLLMSGHITALVHHKDGTTDEYSFDNAILDSGLDLLNQYGFSGGTYPAEAWLGCCRVGTNGAAVNTTIDVALGTQVQSTITLIGSIIEGVATSSSPRYNYLRKTFRFAEGSINANISEVGVGAGSATALWCRALTIPASITVTSTDTLDIVYELRTYVPTADATGSITLAIAGTTHTYVLRPFNINTLNQSYGDSPFILGDNHPFYLNGYATCYQSGTLAAQTATTITATAQQISSNTTATRINSYTTGLRYIDIRFAWGLTSLNIYSTEAPWNVLVFATDCGQWQCSFDPPIPKDHTKKFSLDVRFSFGRYP
jgi:hypothetical protein